MRLHTLRTGSDGSTPILLLHAFPLDHRMWLAAADAIPGPRTVLAVDLPDRTSPLPAAASIDAAADELAATLVQARIGPVVPVGLSMGGYLALALADRHPGVVAGLGLADTRAAADAVEVAADRRAMALELESSGSLDPVRPMVAGLLGTTTAVTRPEIVAQVAAWVEEQSPQVVAWCQRAMAGRPDRAQVLAGFAGPTAVLVGDEDRLTGIEVARELAGLARDARLVVVPNAGHLSAVEAPAAVGLALAELAQRADSAQRR
jgi:pimeloyl-ACP methyl ester carboxylesterase